jgi:subtilisin family serine protease
MYVRRDWLEELIFRGEASRRFTQDSPVLPDVWLAFGEAYCRDPLARRDLLLTPHRNASAAQLGYALQQRLRGERRTREWRAIHRGEADADIAAHIAYNAASVAARLSFDELIRVVLPLSDWWREVVPSVGATLDAEARRAASRALLLAELARVAGEPRSAARAPSGRRGAARRPISPDLIWMIRVVGTILLAARETAPPDADPRAHFLDLSARHGDVLDAVAALVRGMHGPDARRRHPVLYSVSLNRRVTLSVARSTLAVKADAARLLFHIESRNIAWAVVDSGIDATHPAFRARDARTGRPHARPFERVAAGAGGEERWANRTRVARTFEFSRIRQILEMDASADERLAHAAAATGVGAARRRRAAAAGPGGVVETVPRAELARRAAELQQRLLSGRPLDWDELEPMIEVAHRGGPDGYRSPASEHGTHVAGILAADWQRKDWSEGSAPDGDDDLVGMCPDLTLYDFRVVGADGSGDEFTVMAALQFIRHLNQTRDKQLIHGANLSLSLKHDVANYACGRTPVCDECERAISSGVVVVAAAGNEGYMRFETPTGDSEGYRSISITDPGNADGVITVGATHRYQPHTYGVSYFSSRGPTGDGRIKPDLVAPGEKIVAPIPGGRLVAKDGTSMAAPHVSGAAVLLMARHRELIGQPKRIKAILCGTATDLGRERYFQGHGMLDVLRAIQSV